MRVSRYLLPTLMNDPKDADIDSSKLMIRSGMVRKLASGIYEWLPIGLRVLRKVENIVRDEMDRIGGQEVVLPIMLPKELWEETGRWEKYGKELIRLKDRKSMDFCLAPTHEEVITDIVRNEIRSYRELPIMLYQFGLKYRDEMRPRFGVIRAREFYMKDAYSFHATEECAEKFYGVMCDAYTNICKRCGIKFKMVEASSGLIGGKFSHEFIALADAGEDEIVICDNCGYAANVETAVSKVRANTQSPPEALGELFEVYTPNLRTVEEVGNFLKKSHDKFIKCLIYVADKTPVAVLIRGDREINETKLKAVIGCDELAMADPETIKSVTGADVGFAGPVGLNLDIFADESVVDIVNAVSGANKNDYHLMNINIWRDYRPKNIFDIKKVSSGDMCSKCSGKLIFHKGIEVAHTFKLGKLYSESMCAVFSDSDGERKHFIMGCYGVGVSRMVAAIIEQWHDDDGIIWPISVAPFHVVIVPINWQDEKLRKVSEEIYSNLINNGVEVLLDDRDERAGVKLKDADLIGIPIRIVVSESKLGGNLVEIKLRHEKRLIDVSLGDLKQKLAEITERLWNSLRN